VKYFTVSADKRADHTRSKYKSESLVQNIGIY